MGIMFTYFGFIKEYYGKNVTDKLSTVPDDLLCFGLQGSSDKKYIDQFVIMHHCVRSVSFGSRVLLILILFYTLHLLQTPAADINDSRECLGLTSKCITSTNFQIFEEISPRKDDCKFVSFNFSVDICINYSQKKQTSHPRDLQLIQSLGQRQNPLECKWNNKQIQRIIYSFRSRNSS